MLQEGLHTLIPHMDHRRLISTNFKFYVQMAQTTDKKLTFDEI